MHQVNYLNHRGAGVMRAFPDESALQAFISRLQHTATVRDENGNDVGRVWHDRHDGWLWYYEKGCGESPPGAPGIARR